jgi:signal transduction histidine kinase
MSALQRQVRLKENLAALGEMSAGIAHEFKNALATIAGYAQMIQSEKGKPEVSDNAARILEQTRALSHVVTEFLRFARPMEVAADDVALDALVERVREEAAQTMPHVKFIKEGAFHPCAGDEGLLRQAFLNLARNAAEAVGNRGAEGRVVIRGEVEEPAGRALQRITFADNGPGIEETDLPRIFLPFYTTKADGTGLGLALVQKIIVHHGGAVEARNADGGGAEFIVTLPARSPGHQAIDSPPDRI